MVATTNFRPLEPIAGEPDIDESYIRQCDPVLQILLIDRTMTALNRGTPVVTEQCKKMNPEERLKWAEVAVQGCYGFEWQSDNEHLSSDKTGGYFPVASAYREAK